MICSSFFCLCICLNFFFSLYRSYVIYINKLFCFVKPEMAFLCWNHNRKIISCFILHFYFIFKYYLQSICHFVHKYYIVIIYMFLPNFVYDFVQHWNPRFVLFFSFIFPFTLDDFFLCISTQTTCNNLQQWTSITPIKLLHNRIRTDNK